MSTLLNFTRTLEAAAKAIQKIARKVNFKVLEKLDNVIDDNI